MWSGSPWGGAGLRGAHRRRMALMMRGQACTGVPHLPELPPRLIRTPSELWWPRRAQALEWVVLERRPSSAPGTGRKGLISPGAQRRGRRTPRSSEAPAANAPSVWTPGEEREGGACRPARVLSLIAEKGGDCSWDPGKKPSFRTRVFPSLLTLPHGVVRGPLPLMFGISLGRPIPSSLRWAWH